MSDDIVDRLRERAETATESCMMSAVRDTLEWEAADEILFLRLDVHQLKKIKSNLVAALEECLREHGGFTIRGLCERRARIALSAAKAP